MDHNHSQSMQTPYDPNRLFDVLLTRTNTRNDAALSRMLGVSPTIISKVRHHRLPVGATLLIRAQEITGMSVRELRKVMGDRRARYRMQSC